jgi:GNAT superfamily N-acetyltransferase
MQSSGPIIRKAVPEDAEASCVVVRRSITECCVEDHQNNPAILARWLDNKIPENLRTWFQSRGYPVVAVDESRTVGTAMLGANGSITLLYLIPEARYRGIGKALLSALETEASKRGLRQIELSSTKTAHDFYRRNGYSDTGHEASAFGLTAQLMKKDITSPSLTEQRSR